MDLVVESHGNFNGRSWKVLEFFARLWCGRQTQWCRCRCRCRNMRVLTSVTSFPTICLLFLTDSDQRILEYWCSYHTMSIYVVSNFCLSLYLHVGGVRESPGKMFLGYWKVLEKFWKFFWTKERERCSFHAVKCLVLQHLQCLAADDVYGPVVDSIKQYLFCSLWIDLQNICIFPQLHKDASGSESTFWQ